MTGIKKKAPIVWVSAFEKKPLSNKKKTGPKKKASSKKNTKKKKASSKKNTKKKATKYSTKELRYWQTFCKKWADDRGVPSTIYNRHLCLPAFQRARKAAGLSVNSNKKKKTSPKKNTKKKASPKKITKKKKTSPKKSTKKKASPKKSTKKKKAIPKKSTKKKKASPKKNTKKSTKKKKASPKKKKTSPKKNTKKKASPKKKKTSPKKNTKKKASPKKSTKKKKISPKKNTKKKSSPEKKKSNKETGLNNKLKILGTRELKNTRFVIAAGTILDYTGCAILNAANTGGIGGGGIDGMISKAGGDKLLQERLKLPILKGGLRIPVGDSRVTRAGALPNKYVIHAVGPDFSVGQPLKSLKSAYISALKNAERIGCKTVALLPLSAGIFRGDKDLKSVIFTAMDTVKTYLKQNKNNFSEIVMCAYTKDEQDVLKTYFDKKL